MVWNEVVEVSTGKHLCSNEKLCEIYINEFISSSLSSSVVTIIDFVQTSSELNSRQQSFEEPELDFE